MSSTFQSFVRFIFMFVIVNVALLVLRHQRHINKIRKQTKLDTGKNLTKIFEDIVIEYKRLQLRSNDISKSKSQFDLLVEQYKKSAPRDLLNLLYQKVENVEDTDAEKKDIAPEIKAKVKGIFQYL